MAEQLFCPACSKPVGSKSALTAHIKKDHGDEAAVVGLMAKYGAMAPRPGGAFRPSRPLRAAPSGVPSIDYAIGIGGLPLGTIVEIFGPPSSGKTLVALTFAAYAQQQGELAGYVDAEHRLQPTFAALVDGLDLDKMYYGEPDGGETALNATKDFVSTGLYRIWIVDSVHGCVPKALRDKDIGDDTMAELARLMSAGCQVLEPIVSETSTVIIFCNHVKAKPAVRYGRDWTKPGGTALDYYASIQLRVQPTQVWLNHEGRKIGHSVKVKVENSKVAAPFAVAEYDVFYKADTIKTTDKQDSIRNGQKVRPGIDIGSCWFSVCETAEIIQRRPDSRWVDSDTGESYGYKREVVEMLEADCELRRKADDLVYGTYARHQSEPAAA